MIRNSKIPLAIDLFCGLGGWTEGLLAEGWNVIGFDIERHDYGTGCYPSQLCLHDVLDLHGSQFRNADLIVASPPCQAYSYRAMPWKRAKALPPPTNELFDACFRIQREACEAAGRHIPLVVENVRGAQPWVGDAKWHYGSFYLWGDVPALMPNIKMKAKWIMDDYKGKRRTVEGLYENGKAIKGTGGSWYGDYQTQKQAQDEAIKQGGDWFNKSCTGSMSRRFSSRSKARKAASAQIAKIPLALSRHIGAVYFPA